MIRIEYLLDGLEEIIGDEKTMSYESLNTVSYVIKQAVNGIYDAIKGYDVNFQRNVINKLVYVIAKNRFARIFVYSQFKTFPGLYDLSVAVGRETRLNATTGSLNTFYDVFIRNNIDNSLSEGFRRYIGYAEFVIDDLNDMKLPEKSSMDLIRIYDTVLNGMYRQNNISFIGDLGVDLKDRVIQDLLEYMDMNILGEYDDSLGDKIEILMDNTSDLIEDGISKLCDDFNYTMGSSIGMLKDSDYDKIILAIKAGFRIMGSRYISEVERLTRTTDSTDREIYTNKFSESATNMFLLSYARNIISHRLKYIKDNIMTDKDDVKLRLVHEVSFLLLIM